MQCMSYYYIVIILVLATSWLVCGSKGNAYSLCRVALREGAVVPTTFRIHALDINGSSRELSPCDWLTFWMACLHLPFQV